MFCCFQTFKTNWNISSKKKCFNTKMYWFKSWPMEAYKKFSLNKLRYLAKPSSNGRVNSDVNLIYQAVDSVNQYGAKISWSVCP